MLGSSAIEKLADLGGISDEEQLEMLVKQVFDEADEVLVAEIRAKYAKDPESDTESEHDAELDDIVEDMADDADVNAAELGAFRGELKRTFGRKLGKQKKGPNPRIRDCLIFKKKEARTS